MVALDARKTEALLAYLAVTGRSHSRETLLTLLWPNLEPQRAQNVLRRNLSTLNKALEGQWLVIEGDIIGLDEDADVEVDVDRFRQLASRGQNHDHAQSVSCEECLSDLEKATAIYQADFLAGFTVRGSINFDNWQLLEAEQLQREFASVLERLVQGHSAQHAFGAAIDYAQRWLALDPLREAVHRQLMILYAQNGDRSAALRQYQRCRQLLQEELGVEPESETIALYERLRNENQYSNVGQDGLGSPRDGETFAGPAPPSPYRGLFAFGEEDAANFYGRDSFVQQLLANVHERDMVAVIGPSGSGKSSVVFAGLFPVLRQDEQWIILPFRPGVDPYLGLASVLLPQLEPELSELDALVETQKLARSLASGALSLRAVVSRIVQKRETAAKLLLVTDQFEELYTLCPNSQLRHDFLTHLFDTIEEQRFQRSSNFGLLFTLRADFMEQALTFRPMADAMQDAALILGPMRRAELCDVVQRPAETLGVQFEAGLIERILDDVGEAPGNLPLLEFALAMLWEQQQNRLLTHEGYEKIARVEGALTHHADHVIDALRPEEKELARRILIQLVKPGEGTEDTRRVAQREELSSQEWTLVQRLADARLVVTGRDAFGSETVEVVHEALICNWQRFREWMDADRNFRAWQERLRSSLRQWESSDHNVGALLTGVPLAEAEGWLTDRQVELRAQEIDFIQASIDLRERRAAEREKELLARERLRQRILLGLVVGLAVVVLLLGLAGWQYTRAEEQRQAARGAESRAALERDQAQTALSRQLATQAASLQEDQLDLSLLLSVEANRIADTVDARGSLRSGLASNARLEKFLHGHTDRVTSVAYGADGRKLVSGSNDNTILIWDDAGGQLLGQAFSGHSDNVLSVDISPDGQVIASGGADKKVILWDAADGRQLGQPLLGHMAAVSSVVFSPDGELLATSGGDDIFLWDLSAGTPVSNTLSGHSGVVRSVAFSPNRQFLASGGDDKNIILWDLSSGEPAVAPLSGHTALLRSVDFSPDGKMLASADEDGVILLWDLAGEPTLVNTLAGHSSSVRSVQFNPQPPESMPGDVLASAGTDGVLILWDVESGWPLGEPLTGHSDWVRGISFSPDGQTLASAGHDKRVILWDVSNQRQDPFMLGIPLHAHHQGVRAVALSPDGQTIASGSDEETIILWDAADGWPLGNPLRGHNGGVRSVAFSPDGRFLASGSDDETVILWDMAAREAVGSPLSGHTDSVHSVAFSPNGQTLASGSKDEHLILWNTADGEALGPPIKAHEKGVQKVAFSPDGRYLASAGDDSRIKLWAINGEPVLQSTLTGHADVVFSVAFSPDSQTLASSSWDKKILLWDVASGEVKGLPMSGHTESVQDVAFAPDGRTLASGSWDESVMLWDSASGLPLTARPPLTGHTGSVRSVAFSADGGMMVSAGDDSIIIRWDVDRKSWQEQACERANRNLTQAEWQQYFGDQSYVATCPDLPEASN
jgi:WD40 repeat protein/DNA-binding SARP family transcriptional activator